MSDQVVSYQKRGTVGWITLDDGGPNTINQAVFDGFAAALDAAEADCVDALVIAGREGFFSAGMDLKWMPTLSSEDLAEVAPNLCRLALRIFMFPRPVVAACTGHAIAGGAILLLSCDRSVGAEGDFKFGLNEVAIGLPFGGFALELAQAHLSPKANFGLLNGDLFDTETALDVGFLDQLVPADQVMARAGEIAERVAELKPFAYTATKQSLRGPAAERIQEALDSGYMSGLFALLMDQQ